MTLADRVVVLRDGNIEQVGTPLELYDHPANRFVAQFIGTPQMNVVPVEELPALAGKVGVKAGSLGLRPEHVVMAEEVGDALPATVELVEALGDETLVYARLTSGSQLVCKQNARTRARVGDRVGLRFDEGYVHVFDAAGHACAR